MARILRSSGLVAIALGLVLTPGRAAGQEQPKSGLIGRVHDDRSGEVVPAAEVFIDGQPSKATLSSQARFVISNLTPGHHRIEIRAIGYRLMGVEIDFAPGQVVDRTFDLTFTGERLPDVEVEAKVSKTLPRFAEFERRRARGIGHFITRDEIKARGYTNVGDALRTVKGVRVNCNINIECFVQMVRAAPGCGPIYYVDGQQARSFAESTAIQDIQGIEVYRGSAEVPGEYSGSFAGCGVVAIWTRAAP